MPNASDIVRLGGKVTRLDQAKLKEVARYWRMTEGDALTKMIETVYQSLQDEGAHIVAVDVLEAEING